MAKTELKDLIIAYRNEGLSYANIAEKLGVTAEYARNIYSRDRRRKNTDKMCHTDNFCMNCGKQLVHTDGKKKKIFCDNKCRNEYHNRQHAHIPYLCICEYCGIEFVVYGNPKKRFCSRECQTLAGRRG